MAFQLKKIVSWARDLKRDVVALWIASRDRRTPFAAKLVAGTVAAYALSPIDLIPDVIPVLGQLDDLLIVPLGIMLALRLIPPSLIQEFRVAALSRSRPRSSIAAATVIGIWILGAVLLTMVLVWQGP